MNCIIWEWGKNSEVYFSDQESMLSFNLFSILVHNQQTKNYINSLVEVNEVIINLVISDFVYNPLFHHNRKLPDSSFYISLWLCYGKSAHTELECFITIVRILKMYVNHIYLSDNQVLESDWTGK